MEVQIKLGDALYAATAEDLLKSSGANTTNVLADGHSVSISGEIPSDKLETLSSSIAVINPQIDQNGTALTLVIEGQ